MDYIEKKGFQGGTEITICRTQIPTEEGELALKLMTHFAEAFAFILFPF